MLAVTAPKIVVDYRDFPAVNMVRECTPEEFFKHTFSDEGLGDKRCKRFLAGRISFSDTLFSANTTSPGRFSLQAC